jgi:type I restriction enzyme S subunit
MSEGKILGNQLQILSGFPFPSTHFTSERDGEPLIRIRDLQQQNPETFFSGDYDSSFLVSRGDVLVGMDGDFNAVKWQGPQALLNQRVCKITTKDPAVLNQDFLYHSLQPHLNNIHKGTAQTTVKHLSTKDLYGIDTELPPLPEQKRIAEILSGIDGAIAKLKCKARKLDSLQFSLTEEFAQELHDKGEPSALEENAEIRTGVAKNSNNEGDMVEMPYMRVANVQDGYLDLSEIKMISIDRGRIGRYLLQKGDVLINEGGDLDKVGRGVIWHEEIKECLHQNHVFAVRCSERLMPEFLSLYLKSSHSKNYFLGCAKQTTNLASINSTQLKSFPIPVPELSVQEKFVKRITSTKDLSFAIATEISGLGAIKKAISGDLLSGRKRVSI